MITKDNKHCGLCSILRPHCFIETKSPTKRPHNTGIRTNPLDQDIEQFYEKIKELLKLVKKYDVMGDFNAKMGKGEFE